MIRLSGATPWRGSGVDFENAVMGHLCRFCGSSWGQVDRRFTRADDIVHETQGMRSSNDFKPERHSRGLLGTMPA